MNTNIFYAEISTFKYISLDVEHYYCSMCYYDKDNEYQIHELQREITLREAKALDKKDGSRSYKRAFELDDKKTTLFNTKEQIKTAAIKFTEENNGTILIVGNLTYADPQLIWWSSIKGLPIDELNELYEAFEKLDWDKKDEKELKEYVSTQWYNTISNYAS